MMIRSSTTTSLIRAVQACCMAGPSMRSATSIVPPVSVRYSHRRNTRHMSSLDNTQQPSDSRRSRTRYITASVLGIAVLSFAYGGYIWWYSLAEWPEPVRSTLRKAIRYRNDHKPVEAEREFRKALEEMYSLPSTSFSPDPLHKLTGLHITLASFYSSTNQNLKAYLQLRQAFEQMGLHSLSSSPSQRISGQWAGYRLLTHDEHLRGIALAQGLGAAAASVVTGKNRMKYPVPERTDQPQSWDEAAQYYLEGALNALLRLGLQDRSSTAEGPVVVGRDVEIPESRESADSEVGGKIDKKGMGVTMELLSEVYARKGRYDLAGQLLIQAVSTLLPARSDVTPSLRDRCQAAQLMTTISTYALEPPSSKQIKASRSWSLRALQIANDALEEGGGSPADEAMNSCLRAKATGQYNLGVLAEMDKEPRTALGHLEHALATARSAAFVEGRQMVTEAMQRIRKDLKASD